jgi:predicted phosphodiesterase
LTSVAALYDIHGNAPALRAVLDEIDPLSVEVIVIGGDIAWGPFPKETLSMLRALGERAVFIRGNADRELADPKITGAVHSAVTFWCAEQLTAEERRFLGNLPESVSLDIDGLGPTLFCHGSPRSDEEIITPATPDAVVAPMLAGVAQKTVLCGHTHMQYDRHIDGVRLVNAGSVGMPYEDTPGAYWTLLGPSVDLRRTTYDFAAAAEEVRASGCPDADEIAMGVYSPTGQAAGIIHFERTAGRERDQR